MQSVRSVALAALCVMALASCGGETRASDRFILATTHTLEDSGLLDSLTAGFAADHPEHPMDVVVAGSGEVLAMGSRGDVDAVLTHDPAGETAFVAQGHGLERRPVMHNTFVIAGSTRDSARVARAPSAVDAFTRIRTTGQPFVSRGDDSGTHRKELSIWKAAGGKPQANYIEAATSMADALRVANERHAYILTDLATFLTIKDRLDLELLFQGDTVLRNDYSMIVLTRARNAAAANAFADWITSVPVQKKIGQFGRSAFGRPLFSGDASK